MRPYEPLFRNPHTCTILANFWPRKYDWSGFPMEDRLVQTDPDTQVRVQTQHPQVEAIGEVVLVHGLEGGGDSGYIVSMAWHALHAGFVVHRFHMRTCRGTAHLCKTLYHAGLTSDLRVFLESRSSERLVFLVGYSLGANVSLKLAGDLGETDLIHGVCAISTPIDLAASVRNMAKLHNRLYERRFVKRMRKRVFETGRYEWRDLRACRSLYEFDDKITAPSFGFRGADHYYETQSCQNVLDRIRVPTLLIQAKDDTYIPFECYNHPAIAGNPNISLLATEHGGHLGFLNRRGQRFWLDEAAIHFLKSLVGQAQPFPHSRTTAGACGLPRES